ncbi:uncharacterized protein [Malus domestica]|uniref:uncharacterized protein n=1 Tax=Malus domestica TaxID=3750 RepID=UPI003975A8D5
MTNISMSPFTNEIERTDPPRRFTMPHFIPYKGDEDPDPHLKHYHSTMILYRNNDALMCKIFATTLQGEVLDWFHTLSPQSIRSFNELSFVFTKEYSSNRLIKRTSDHLFSIVKDHWETIRDYVKRFKTEKAKIVGCNEDIATKAFRNGLPTKHPLLRKLIMGEELTLAASYALAKKHALWDEAKQSNKNESEKKHMERSLTREDSAPKTFTKFTVPIGQILRKLKNEPWFELPTPMKGNLTRLDHTKYCAFHQGPSHATNGFLKWKQYLKKLTNEGRCDEYLDKSTKQPTQTGEKLSRCHGKVVRCIGKAQVCEMDASSSKSTTGQVITLTEEVATLKGQPTAQQAAREAKAAAQEAWEAEIVAQFSAQDEKMSMILRALQMFGLQIPMPAHDLDPPSTSQPLPPANTQ